MGQGDGAHNRGEWLMDIGELIEAVTEELGPSATDDEIALRLLDRLEVLSDSDKTTVIDQILSSASNTQLAHLREVLEATTDRDIPSKGQPE